MDASAERALGAVVKDGLARCAAKLSRISGAEWSVSGSSVRRSTMAEIAGAQELSAEGGAAVYFEITGRDPFSAMVVFRAEDLEIIARGFLGYSYSKLPVLNQAQELLLSELGNILLNSLLGALSNSVGSSFIPSAPKCVQGAAGTLVEALWAVLDDSRRYSVALMKLNLVCEGKDTRMEVIAAIPESLEKCLADSDRT